VNIGVLTAGGDSPGLNAAIRAIGKTAIREHGMRVIGFRDGFRGLAHNRVVRLGSEQLSGILTLGGTILGTSRDKPHRMLVGEQRVDMTQMMLDNFAGHNLDAVICLGGGGTQKNALRLSKAGMPIVTLPKTIDNDVAGTDASLGFDTALGIATEAIDRLHSTAHSHHRIVVVEVMGHNAGWLALGSGLAGGADVILIPEIPHDVEGVAEAVMTRKSAGSTFSIVAVSEGAMAADEAAAIQALTARRAAAEASAEKDAAEELAALIAAQAESTSHLAKRLEGRTGLEARVTILGHVQRGGTPSAFDRLLATQLGSAATHAVAKGSSGVMIGLRDGAAVEVPLEDVAGRRHVVPADHEWIKAARSLSIGLGD